MTHNQLNVLDVSLLEEGSAITHQELEALSRDMALSLRQLIEQRDKGSEVLLTGASRFYHINFLLVIHE